MTRATVPVFAHPYAHPVENRRPGTPQYGPHASELPAATTVTCAGRYPLTGCTSHTAYRHDVVQLIPQRAHDQRRELNTTAHEQALHANTMEPDMTTSTKRKPAGTYDDPLPWLSGWCNPSNDDMSHARCGTWYDERGAIHRCRCDREGCRCNSDRGHPLDATPQRHMLGVDQPAPAAAVPATAWTADEVVDLMVELEDCPLCNKAWGLHVFTDDDRVVCA